MALLVGETWPILMTEESADAAEAAGADATGAAAAGSSFLPHADSIINATVAVAESA
jgi:hypothetical protein